MIPHYTKYNQVCERCDSTIYIGHYATLYEDLLFCDGYCAMEHWLEYESGIKTVELTNDPIYRGVD